MLIRSALISLLLLWSQTGMGQGLVLAMKNGFLEISHQGPLGLEYLSADDFQVLDWQSGYAYFLDGSARKYAGLKYNPAEDQWTPLAKSPYHVGASSMIVIDDMIYCIGGSQSGNSGAEYKSVIVYDISENSWALNGFELS